jgi:hypothetical protein
MALSLLALATNGGPTHLRPLGWDEKEATLYVVAETEGTAALYTISVKNRRAGPPALRPREKGELELLETKLVPLVQITAQDALQTPDVELSGRIRDQRLVRFQDSLLPVYSIEARVGWRGARKSVVLESTRGALVSLTGAWTIPGTECAYLTVAVVSGFYEGGYFVDTPVVLCAGTKR